MKEHIDRLSQLLRTSWLHVPFRYRPLDGPDRQIRLIRIRESTHRGGMIHLEMRHSQSLWWKDETTMPVYTAVSYTWGEEAPLHTVLIDGARFQIRSNLHSYLYTITLTEETNDHWFWIDQICIDQANTRERNAQVQLMDAIYNTAKKVHVWLGEGDQVYRLAFSALACLVGKHEAYSLERTAMQHVPWQRGLDLDRQHKARSLHLRKGRSMDRGSASPT